MTPFDHSTLILVPRSPGRSSSRSVAAQTRAAARSSAPLTEVGAEHHQRLLQSLEQTGVSDPALFIKGGDRLGAQARSGGDYAAGVAGYSASFSP